MQPTFNLVTEPWIPVVTLSGQWQELSLREVLAQAHELRSITDNNPLTTAALHSLLLAILHRAIAGPKNYIEWKQLWHKQNLLDPRLENYLTDWQHRFDLFAPDYPFYQTAHFTTRSAPISIRKLFHELATANNKTLFDHNVDEIPLYLTPNLAARALLTTQMYSLGGGKGTTSEQFGEHPYLAHASLIAGVVVLVLGQNLFETLLLNLMVYDCDHPKKPIPRNEEVEDLPVWEQVTYLKSTSVGRTPNGYLDYLTWRSRHLRLLPTPTGNVAQLYLAQADVLANAIRDPRFAYKINADKEKFPVKLSIERAFWRDSGSLFAFSDEYRPLVFKQVAELEAKLDEDGYSLPANGMKCLVIGLANDKANPLLWRAEELPIPEHLLTHEQLPQTLDSALKWAEEIGKLLRFYLRKLAELLLTQGQRNADKNKVSDLTQDWGTEAAFWSNLELPFRQFLADLPNYEVTLDNYLTEWQITVRKIAIFALETTTQNCLHYSAREMQARVKVIAQFNGYTYKLLPSQIREAAA